MKLPFAALRSTLTFGILVRTLLLTGGLLGVAYAWLYLSPTYALLASAVAVAQVADLIRYQNRANRELAQFALAVRYRDFSLHFNERDAPASVRELRQAFNAINATFRQLSNEREAQYQYLQTILELVDTGILSFDADGEVEWMNESLKRLLGVPYLKNIHALARRDERLYQLVRRIQPGESKLIQLHTGKNPQVLLSATALRTDGRAATLLGFQNVNAAVEETENQAWQKLLRVMTHEIMNSVAPIASLSDTLQRRLAGRTTTAPLPADLDDIAMGIEVIRNRSEGLLRFAETYRNMSKITTLTRTRVPVRDVFEQIYQLMEQGLAQKGIELDIILKDPSLPLEADIRLVEQVLINLVLNAAEAVRESPQPNIRLVGTRTDEERTVLEVGDNGAGMTPEVLANIFVPFFTTKKNGSGIGLSLSKQIMQLHNGSIRAQSVEGQGSVFRLEF